MLHLDEILPQLVASGSLAAAGYAVYAIVRQALQAVSRMSRSFHVRIGRYPPARMPPPWLLWGRSFPRVVRGLLASVRW